MVAIPEEASAMDQLSDRELLSRLVDASDQIAEESLGIGDPDSHPIEDQRFEAIDDFGHRGVIKGGNIYLLDPNDYSGENVLVDPAGPEDLADSTVLKLDKSWF